jgi:flavin reductase (DIM6/NTAB) family NADH-FMN oxidoreductase RutF
MGHEERSESMQRRVSVATALARKYPEAVVLVTTRSPRGAPNAMTVGWVTIASGEPPMFVLGIDAGAYTYRLIRATREFVVAFPHEGMAAATLYVGSRHGRGRDKLAECGLATQKAARVRAPLIAGAVANFECVLVRVVKPGDCPLVIGRVVAAHVRRGPSLRRLYTVAPGHAMGGVRRAVAVPRGKGGRR